MSGARNFLLIALCFAVAALAFFAPAATRAQTIDLSLNVFYTTPSNANSGGTWELVAKSSNFGIAGLTVKVANLSAVDFRAPAATVNGSYPAGFNIFADVFHPASGDTPFNNELTFGQADLSPLPLGFEQTAFYGVGQLANGAPNWPGKPAGSNSEGPAFTSLTSPFDIPWATGDAFNNAAWNTAARFASGTFAAGVTPSFVLGSASGNVFTTLGTSQTFGNVAPSSSVTMIVRTNLSGILGDYNLNGVVDAADYIIWRNTQNQDVPAGTGADGSGNGLVDAADYEVWRAHFGNTSGAGVSGNLSTSTVPEPVAGTLLAAAVALAAATTRRRQKSPLPLGEG